MKRLIALALFAATPAAAQNELFSAGPVFTSFGKIAATEGAMPLPKGVVFKVAFDAHEAGKPGELNRTLNTAARFVNMHAAAGVPLKNIHVAVVVHSPAIFDVANDTAYARQYPGKTNPNKAAVAELLAKGVQIIVCGQSMASLRVTREELLPGVPFAISAMTAHALLQQQGYTLNPF